MSRPRAFRIVLSKKERKIIRHLQKKTPSPNARTRFAIILEADEKPQVLRADLDLTALKDRETRFAARRPDQYGLLVKTEQESVK